jgi:hypothetical protein
MPSLRSVMSARTLRVVVDVPTMRAGTRVEVRSSFEGSWVSGFEVVATDDDGQLRLRRVSDGEELPAPFAPDAVRRERRRETWWV